MNPAAPSVRPSPGSSISWLATRSQGHCPRGSVLLHAPSFAFQAPGGGENQLVQTGRHLEGMGIPVRLFSAWTDRLETARLLHLFGMSREGLELARVAKSRGLPVVLSPICWYEPLALAALETDLVRKLASLAVWGLRLVTPRIPSWRRELLNLADLVLPNSLSEAAQFVRMFGVARERIRAVPNGVLATVASASPELFQGRFGADPFVLTVGRIEPRKNTLGVGPSRSTAGCADGGHRRGSPGFSALRTRLPARVENKSSGWDSSTITIRCWPRPTRQRGSLPCQAGSRRPDWPRSKPRLPAFPS